MTDPLRDHLLERLRRLPANKLPQVEAILSHLECGNSLPLSFLSPSNIHSTTDQQRLAAQVATAAREQRKESGDESPQSKDWPHAPLHSFEEHGTYIVTAGTFGKEHHFRGPERLDFLEDKLLSISK